MQKMKKKVELNTANTDKVELNTADKEKHKSNTSAYIKSHKGLSDLATVIGSADFTSHEKRIELLDLLGGLTPLDVEGEQTLLQGLVAKLDAPLALHYQ